MPQEREELFTAWRVDPLSKERKLQLVQKLWSRDILQQPDGMQRSSELVVQLCGMDASEHMMELVFGKFQREQEVRSGEVPGAMDGRKWTVICFHMCMQHGHVATAATACYPLHVYAASMACSACFVGTDLGRLQAQHVE